MAARRLDGARHRRGRSGPGAPGAASRPRVCSERMRRVVVPVAAASSSMVMVLGVALSASI